MKAFSALLALLICLSPLSSLAQTKFKVAVIGKTKNDSFYEQSFGGCKKFANTVDDLTCIYDGPNNYQDPRAQAKVVDRIIKLGIDGILISTTNSNFLVERVLKIAKKKNIPVITFDSDLLPEHQDYRLAYVGTNNFDFGKALGDYAQRFKRSDGMTEICIQSGSDSTPNLNERVRGVRHSLSGGKNDKRLRGETGWIEHKRCPFYTTGKRALALDQLKYLLKNDKPIIYLAVAGFAQFSQDYISQITPYQYKIRSGEEILISADAEAVQLAALERNLSTVNIGQRPFEMGRYSAELIYDVLKNGKMPKKEINYLGFFYCIEDAGVSCTLSPQ